VRKTKYETVLEMGINPNKVDFAIPQHWLTEMVDNCHFDYDTVLSSFVWSYDQSTHFGVPQPLTEQAKQMLIVYDQTMDTHYSDTIKEIVIL
jgi:hypothetical protein